MMGGDGGRRAAWSCRRRSGVYETSARTRATDVCKSTSGRRTTSTLLRMKSINPTLCAVQDHLAVWKEFADPWRGPDGKS